MYFTYFVLTILTIFYFEIQAHPGIGFVKDSKGNLYYTDLKQIWKQTREGQTSIAVPNVHSHELCIDSMDNLYGEHLWYVATTKKYLHYGWRLESTGKLSIVKETQIAYESVKDYSYVRNKAGEMFWYEKTNLDSFQFIKLDLAGKKSTIASGMFKNIRWMYCSPKLEIYFLDIEDLYKIKDNGEILSISKNLGQDNSSPMLLNNEHSVFGIWFDDNDNIYVAITGNHCIKKISPNGETTIVYISKSGSPITGIFDASGNMWVLETCGLYDVKTVKVNLKRIHKSSVWFSNNKISILFILLSFSIIYLYTKRKKIKL